MQRFKDMERSTKWASGLTLGWALGIACIVCLALRFDWNRSVIALVDVVAGSCAIPALVWLIFGHYQQGQELQRQKENFLEQLQEFQRHNATLTAQNDVLGAQAQELRALAQHTEGLANVAEAERNRVKMREKRQAQPILIPQTDRFEEQHVKTTFSNRGGEIHDISIQPCDGQQNRLDWLPVDFLGTKDSAELTVSKENGNVTYPLGFSIACRDGAGYRHRFVFKKTDAHAPWRQVRPDKEPPASDMPDGATGTAGS